MLKMQAGWTLNVENAGVIQPLLLRLFAVIPLTGGDDNEECRCQRNLSFPLVCCRKS